MACVMVKMANGEGDINISALADGFAIVQTFHHGEQSCVFLHRACKGIEHAGTRCPSCCVPARLRDPGALHRLCHLIGCAQGHARKPLACGRIADGQIVSRGGEDAIDIGANKATVIGNPLKRYAVILRGCAILHSIKNGFYTHLIIQSGDGDWQSIRQ